MDRSRRLTFSALVVVGSLVAGTALVELLLRTVGNQLEYPRDSRNLVYEHHPRLGWFPIPNSRRTFEGTRGVETVHNERGFRDDSHTPVRHPNIVVLGDSFVWGVDAEKEERFTEKLQGLLPGWNVYNLGVSGFGTDQSYLLLQEHIAYYRPRVVLLIFCTDNDEADNTSSSRYGGYYKPYFTWENDGLVLQGVPVPKSLNYHFHQHWLLKRSFLARGVYKAYLSLTGPSAQSVASPTHRLLGAMDSLATANDSQLVVGIQGENPELTEFLTGAGIATIQVGNEMRYDGAGRHWTPEGHDYVASRIRDFLSSGGQLTLER